MADLTQIPDSSGENTLEINETEVLQYISNEGQPTGGIDPVKVAKAIWKWIKDNIDEV